MAVLICLSVLCCPVRILIMMLGLLSITFPIYAISVIQGILKKVIFFEVMPKRIGAKRFSFWRAPQTIITTALLATGSVLVHRVITAPWSSVVFIALFWTFFYTISLGHYFIFAVEYNRLLKNSSKASEAAPASSLSTQSIPAVTESLSHAEETQAQS